MRVLVTGGAGFIGSHVADRFVADWQAKSRQMKAFERQGHYHDASSVKGDMRNMAKALHRDPQLESILKRRAPELALSMERGRSIGQELAQWVGQGRNRDRGMSR